MQCSQLLAQVLAGLGLGLGLLGSQCKVQGLAHVLLHAGLGLLGSQCKVQIFY